jgi:hypothetical protein
MTNTTSPVVPTDALALTGRVLLAAFFELSGNANRGDPAPTAAKVETTG